MKPVLCLDFGTSSIRAALRTASGAVEVLDIGAVTASRSIDSASIRSEICIDEDEDTIRFGERAYEAFLAGKPQAFRQTSPKLWLKEPDKLNSFACPGISLTRKQLIAGLLAYAMFAASQTGKWQLPSSPDTSDVRVAHPVWPASTRGAADTALAEVTWLALNMASAGDWGETSVDVLQSWTETDAGQTPLFNFEVDTLEPVAAAVELLPRISNSRQVCVVVDVGAGTTDIGVFQSLSPDEVSGKENRLIPTGPTLSVFKAGNDIDRTLLRMMSESFPHQFKANRGDLEGRIRSIKESLFKQGAISEQGIHVRLSDLEQASEMRAMTAEIRKNLKDAMLGAWHVIDTWLMSPNAVDKRIVVVMAGGGAEIRFLRDAVSRPMSLAGKLFELSVVTPQAPRGLVMHGAGYTRLAVALGGAGRLYKSVLHEHSQLLRLPGLGQAKQRI